MYRKAVVAVVVCLMLCAVPNEAAGGESLTGTMIVNWADPAPGVYKVAPPSYTLADDDGVAHSVRVEPFLVAAAGGPHRINNQRVRLQVVQSGDPQRATVQLLEFIGAKRAPTDVSGSQPWVSLMCKFSDVAAEPQDLDFFVGMFDNSPGRLDHYWRKVSYDVINVVGSTAAGWVTLPKVQSDYIAVPGQGCLDGNPDNDADLGLLFADCTAAADELIDFSNGGSPYVGINLMFNSDLDGCAWGGGWPAELDEVEKIWRTTWEPPWGYGNVGVMSHEMGHGFGLPHSNNWDNDGSPYDNSWDVMSDAHGWTGFDSTYGRLGKHTIAYHKADILGWILPEEIFIPEDDTREAVSIDYLALEATTNYRMARIPIPDSTRYYTVEARGWTDLYDAHLPGEAIIVHEIDSRSEPAWAYDVDPVPGDDSSGEGTMWRVGETFIDTQAGISVHVASKTAQGFGVVISVGAWDNIFADGFEGGDTTAWSNTVN